MNITVSSRVKKIAACFGLLGFFALSGIAFADDAKGLGAIADSMTGDMGGIVKLLFVISYIMGAGLCLFGVAKLKGHKDNPQQTPLSVPLSLIGIGCCLVFLPTLLSSTGATIFGSNRTSAGIDGGGYQSLEG